MSESQLNSTIYSGYGNCVTPIGFSIEENVLAMKRGERGIQKHQNQDLALEEFYGAIINKKELYQEFSKLEYKGDYSDLEKMLLIALDPIIQKCKNYINEDCGLILSSTKGNIDALESRNEEAYYLSSLAHKICNAVGISREPIVLSNACVSGIMAVSVAKRLMHIGEYKHFIVVGGDLFSRFVFSGFQSFQAVSPTPCKPYDKTRDGITLGEATAALFLSTDSSVFEGQIAYKVVGEGSINDANHISGPSRTGEGLFQSVQSAMVEANLKSTQIDSVSSHGTATNYNDEMEAKAFTRAELQNQPIFSLKPYFGHTLGAAGLLETVITMAFANENLIPPSLNYKEHGLTLPLNINTEFQQKEINYFIKTASGFGGSNTAVIFKKVNSNGI